MRPGWAHPLCEAKETDDGAVNPLPLVQPALWRQLPVWIALHAERGRRPRCFFGHLLRPANAAGRELGRGCFKCKVWPLARGGPILRCRSCAWAVCAPCASLPRLPELRDDPLFHAPGPMLLGAPGAPALGRGLSGRGTVIVCPGGNYEFLCPNEGLPVAAWLESQGIGACVLRYRLLPRHPHSDALDDLALAARIVRAATNGPVAAIGFSAGGHLIASLAAHEDRGGASVLDAQVLVYPGMDGRDWLCRETCGFFDAERCLPVAPTLLARQEALLGGAGFAAPRTLMVASTGDELCPPRVHCEPYVKALKAAGIAHEYLLGDFGPHGFVLEGGWTEDCIRWLREAGFGRAGSEGSA